MSDAHGPRHASVEASLREETGLSREHRLHPVPGSYSTQKRAAAAMERLLDGKDYLPSQVGMFAEEVSMTGQRRFLVDTYAGFCLHHVPPCWTRCQEVWGHYYEVVLQDRPCWLYFDLEFSRETNPERDTAAAMAAFETVLAAYCIERLGVALDSSSLFVLDSSTAHKFSKHVLVKRLSGRGLHDGECIAFANNAQAGLFVSQLVAFARSRAADSVAGSLFVRSSRRSTVAAETATCIIDESVYSRNRCFRMLFQSKFGKSRSLDWEDRNASFFSGTKPHPCSALLHSMVSFVPTNVRLFDHTSVPLSYGHASKARYDEKVAASGRKDRPASDDLRSPLLDYLMEKWDEMRHCTEQRERYYPKTVVRSVVVLNHRFETVKLAHNRFCLNKGASHCRNEVYLVVDKARASFQQMCYDADCHGFRSERFEVPRAILVGGGEEGACEHAVGQKRGINGEETGATRRKTSTAHASELEGGV